MREVPSAVVDRDGNVWRGEDLSVDGLGNEMNELQKELRRMRLKRAKTSKLMHSAG